MTEERERAFDPRMINILKLRNTTECEILIEECRHIIDDINEQMSIPDFGDAEWAEAAARAKRDVSRKLELAKMRLKDLQEREERTRLAVERSGPASAFDARFKAAAKEMLTPDLFACIVEKATIK